MARTQNLIWALRDKIVELVTNEDFALRVKQAYSSAQIDIELLESVLGPEEIITSASAPRIDHSYPTRTTDGHRTHTRSEFYEGEIHSWDPKDNDEDKADEPATAFSQ